MKPLSCALLAACALIATGCSLTDPKHDATRAQERYMDGEDERKERLRASNTLSPQEYEALALRMGWTTKSQSGLPPAPSTEELEKRIKAAETNR